MAREQKDMIETTFRANGALREGHFEVESGLHAGHAFDLAPIITNWPQLVAEYCERMWRTLTTLAPGISAAVVFGDHGGKIAQLLMRGAGLDSDTVISVGVDPETGAYMVPEQDVLRRWSRREVAVVVPMFTAPRTVSRFIAGAHGALRVTGTGAVFSPYGFGAPHTGMSVPFAAGLESPRDKWPLWPLGPGCPRCLISMPMNTR